VSAKDYHWDNQEVKGGYDHDGERRRHKKITEAPAGGDAGLPKLGKCTACHRDAVHRWHDGTLICAKHWTRQLAARAEELASGTAVPKRRRTKTVPEPRRTKPVPDNGRTKYGAKGDKNWEKRAAQ